MSGSATMNYLSNSAVAGSLFSFAQEQELLYNNLINLQNQQYSLSRYLTKTTDDLQETRQLTKELEQSAFDNNQLKKRETFESNIGAYRARAASNNIRLDTAPAMVEGELRGRFERDALVDQDNFYLKQRIDDVANQMKISSLRQSVGTQLNNIDSQIKAIGIKRRYAVISGQVEAAGDILGFINDGTPGGIQLPF